MAIVMRLVQRFQHAKKQEFIELEKQFAELEKRGVLPAGERFLSLAGREPGNTLIWERRFPDLSAVKEFLQLIETSPEHTELAKKQAPFFEGTWLELYEVLDY